MLQQFCCELRCGGYAQRRVIAHRSAADVPELAAAVVDRGDDADDLAVDGILQQRLQLLHDLRITLPCDELDDVLWWLFPRDAA